MKNISSLPLPNVLSCGRRADHDRCTGEGIAWHLQMDVWHSYIQMFAVITLKRTASLTFGLKSWEVGIRVTMLKEPRKPMARRPVEASLGKRV